MINRLSCGRRQSSQTADGLPRQRWPRPIFIKLDLRSVKVHVSMSFCPETVGDWSSSPGMSQSLSKIYTRIQGLFPASPGAQLQEFTASTFSISPGQIRLHSPIGPKTRFNTRPCTSVPLASSAKHAARHALSGLQRVRWAFLAGVRPDSTSSSDTFLLLRVAARPRRGSRVGSYVGRQAQTPAIRASFVPGRQQRQCSNALSGWLCAEADGTTIETSARSRLA